MASSFNNPMRLFPTMGQTHVGLEKFVTSGFVDNIMLSHNGS